MKPQSVGPSHDQKMTIAEKNLPYELETLRGQVALLSVWSGKLADPQRLALLEASLVHVRLLDEFLCSDRAGKDDVRAWHYATSWRAEDHEVLGRGQRHELNAQLFHLAGRREEFHGWRTTDLCRRVCEEFCRFMDEVDGEWLEPLSTAHQQALAGRSC